MAVAGRCWPLFALLLLPHHLRPVGGAARDRGEAVLSAAPGEKIDAAALSQALAESMGYGGGDGVAQLQSALHGIDKEMASLPPALLAGSFARTIAGVLELSRAADAAAGSPMFEAEPETGKTVWKEWVVHAVGTYSAKVSLNLSPSPIHRLILWSRYVGVARRGGAGDARVAAAAAGPGAHRDDRAGVVGRAAAAAEQVRPA